MVKMTRNSCKNISGTEKASSFNASERECGQYSGMLLASSSRWNPAAEQCLQREDGVARSLWRTGSGTRDERSAQWETTSLWELPSPKPSPSYFHVSVLMTTSPLQWHPFSQNPRECKSSHMAPFVFKCSYWCIFITKHLPCFFVVVFFLDGGLDFVCVCVFFFSRSRYF